MKTAEELLKELEEARAKAEALENSKRRVEEENAKYKKRAQEVESQLSEVQKKKLEEENKIHEVLQIEREEKKKIEDNYTKLKSVTAREKLKNEVAALAKDAYDIEDILRVVEAKDELTFDEDTLTFSGVDKFVTKVRTLKPQHFKKSKVNVGEDSPPSKEHGEGETKEEMYLKELRLAKNQKAYDEVRKKFGKI